LTGVIFDDLTWGSPPARAVWDAVAAGVALATGDGGSRMDTLAGCGPDVQPAKNIAQTTAQPPACRKSGIIASGTIYRAENSGLAG